jgi:hypothetical protein
MVAKLKVEGVPEVTRAFDKVSHDIADMTEVHRSEAEMLLSEVAARTRRQTGNLAASWEASGEPELAQFLNPQAYAGVQEFGWSARNIEPTLAVQGAFEANESETERLYGDAIADIGKRADFQVRN